MANKRAKDKRLLVGLDMPPLYHTQPDERYCFKNDEVAKWICQRQGLINYIFDKLSQGGFIVYDPGTKKWYGANFFEE